MKYQTQKIAYAYFLVAMALFIVQVSGGLLAGWLGAQVGVRVTILIMAGVVAVASSSVLLTEFGRRKDLPEPACARGSSAGGSGGRVHPAG